MLLCLVVVPWWFSAWTATSASRAGGALFCPCWERCCGRRQCHLEWRIDKRSWGKGTFSLNPTSFCYECKYNPDWICATIDVETMKIWGFFGLTSVFPHRAVSRKQSQAVSTHHRQRSLAASRSLAYGDDVKIKWLFNGCVWAELLFEKNCYFLQSSCGRKSKRI